MKQKKSKKAQVCLVTVEILVDAKTIQQGRRKLRKILREACDKECLSGFTIMDTYLIHEK